MGDGSVVVSVWREFHGSQTSRRREQLTLTERNGEIVIQDGPAEYHGSRLIRVGEDLLALGDFCARSWVSSLREAAGAGSHVILQRRDPPEPPRGGGRSAVSHVCHPL